MLYVTYVQKLVQRFGWERIMITSSAAKARRKPKTVRYDHADIVFDLSDLVVLRVVKW